jgi:hypothetical protein
VNDNNVQEKTRLRGFSEVFKSTYREQWQYESLKIDLLEAIPLEEGLLFWIYVYQSMTGFGVITSTERR